MVKSILVGASGTRFSQAAVGGAIALAKRSGANLTALAVVDTDAIVAPESVPLGAGPYKRERDVILLAKAHEAADRLLDDVRQKCAAEGVPVNVLKREGEPANLLVLEAQRTDLLIVGKKHLPEQEFERSSHTLRSVLNNTPRPVLCIPEKAAAASAALVAFDGSLQAAKALQLFVACGLADGRELHLLTVAKDAASIAERGIEFMHAHGLKVNIHLQEGDHAADSILETAARLKAGLIVMGAYGRPRVREFIFGSVTRTILHRTTVPLFLYH